MINVCKQEISELRNHCCFVRNTIEDCQKKYTDMFHGFPCGYCNMASIWLYDYLADKGYSNISFRMKNPFLEKYDGNHVWLYWKLYNIDITADQFNDKGISFPKVIVTNNDPIYKEYDNERDYRESFGCDYVPANKYELQAEERIIIMNRLGISPAKTILR